jgi:hypothetical protein
MSIFRKVVQRLSIDFYSRFEAAIRFESVAGKSPDDVSTLFYFFTYYTKMLYNFGAGDDSYFLNRTILESLEDAVHNKDYLVKHGRLVEYKGKGIKTYIAEWDKKGGIFTKIPWGEENEYGPASVFLFLNYLNRTLSNDSRNKLIYCLSMLLQRFKEQGPTETQGLANGISKVSDIISLSSQVLEMAEKRSDRQ